MSLLFEELDSQDSPLGEISLRKRRIPALGDRDIYEVKLGDEFLMSSMFVDAEEALSTLGLAQVEGDKLNVVVGGLGLGYTAVAALADERIAELLVVDAIETVIHWHQQEMVPLGKVLNADPRNRYVLGSFFDLATAPETGFDPQHAGKKFDAILLDIDHSPTEYLNPANAGFYTTANLTLMAEQLVEDGVFAMWSQNPPEDDFSALLSTVFDTVESHLISFDNPFQGGVATNSVYVCKRPIR
ncbi:spermidine synthase [Marinomonas piezotolerans]|uniref:Spermidine synthase n=1 Tax=Marinomonas piezotolerans TaxID=2213058 RepID=A0A370UBV5_9GAMM|nr:spermidine synthase [Marinomonas piezotolerans]RDL45175.1 spermidine synthase [Marinomonas piezotolerans]